VRQLEDRLAVQPFSSREFRDALGAFASGVTVITTSGRGEPYGMTANAFSSLSLDPPLVLVCVVNGTRGCESIEGNGVFAVNILTQEQEALSRYFASRERPRGAAAFADIAHRHVVTGSPVLEGVAAFLDCRLAAQHVAGDHTIFVGEVLALDVDPAASPLLFHRGGYREL
jgi:flavin reductase